MDASSEKTAVDIVDELRGIVGTERAMKVCRDAADEIKRLRELICIVANESEVWWEGERTVVSLHRDDYNALSEAIRDE